MNRSVSLFVICITVTYEKETTCATQAISGFGYPTVIPIVTVGHIQQIELWDAA